MSRGHQFAGSDNGSQGQTRAPASVDITQATLSPGVTAIAQYVGLAFLVGVFLFVTYHDILR